MHIFLHTLIWIKHAHVSAGMYLCNKYIPVFAPGTLGILPDAYLVPVSNGLLGDIVSMYQNMNIKYQNNLLYMGFSNITINYNMGLSKISMIYNIWDYAVLSM